MLTDFVLASLHHLLVFGIAAMLVAQAVLLRGAFDRSVLQRLAGIDRGYGLCAMALIAVGISRVVYGIKGHDFYLHNPWFHAKMGAFVLVGLLSILPTVKFLRWRKAERANPGAVPSEQDLATMRTVLRIELAGIAAIFVLAAAMARYGGF